MERYKVCTTADQRSWVILDREWWGYCTLPDKEDPSSLLPLEWSAREGAEAWLKRCYQQWGKWEQVGAPTPANWHPLPPDPGSPFDRLSYNR
jgi:hypothetical protein